METQLMAETREATGKGAVHKLRRAGRIPAVLYGSGVQPRPLSVDAKEFGRLYVQGRINRLIGLRISGGDRPENMNVLVKEIQWQPLRSDPVHLDFVAVVMDHPVDVRVPVHLVNEAQRVHDGSIVETHMHEIEITCLPGAIPERLDLDISGLSSGESLTVKALTVPKGVTVRSHPEEIIVSAVVPAKPVEPEAPAPAEEAQPAAVKKVKEE